MQQCNLTFFSSHAAGWIDSRFAKARKDPMKAVGMLVLVLIGNAPTDSRSLPPVDTTALTTEASKSAQGVSEDVALFAFLLLVLIDRTNDSRAVGHHCLEAKHLSNKRRIHFIDPSALMANLLVQFGWLFCFLILFQWSPEWG
jgi:hypothetical protein